MKQIDHSTEIEREQAAAKQKKRLDFDAQHQKKHQWFEQNIIIPQIERHLKDYEVEKKYHDGRLQEQHKVELKEAEAKKQREI